MGDVAMPEPAVVCGLIAERGEAARSRTFERRWERDSATLQAVELAVCDAEAGATPEARTDMPPEWLEPLLREHVKMLASHWRRRGPTFEFVRKLERLGIVVFVTDETYVLAAVGGIGNQRPHSRANALRADPELVDRVVWRMFEVEGGGEVSLANIDKFSPDATGWQSAFRELVEDGTLPRERVLTSALDALNRDFSAYRAGWYARLYDHLQPRSEELVRHQPQLRALVRSTVTSTVSFAVDKLWHLTKVGLLDAEPTVTALEPAVTAGPKGVALAALRLLADVLSGASELQAGVTKIATAALAHPHADVQMAAARLLMRVGAGEVVRAVADSLEPSVQLDILGSPPRSTSRDQRRPQPEHRGESELSAPSGRQDLLDRLAAILEDASDPIEVELVLSALAELDDPSTLLPLSKRATSVLRRGPRESVTPLWMRGQIARLILAPSTRDMPARPTARHHVVAFLVRRLEYVEGVLIRSHPPCQLLATPDHAAGWLTPATLLHRLRTATRPPNPYDLVAALLRIHPEGRDAALSEADRSGRPIETAQYALGGEVSAKRFSAGDVPAWIAASRARFPLQDDDFLGARGIVGAGRGGPIDARVVFASEGYTWTDRRGAHEHAYWKWHVVVAGPEEPAPTDLIPTATSGREGERIGAADLEDFVPWISVLYPHDGEHLAVVTGDAVVRAAVSPEVSHDAVRVLTAVGRHPGRLGPVSLTLLGAGLTAARADQRALTVDAILEHEGSGRLTSRGLGEGIAAVSGPAIPSRMAPALRDVAATSREARRFVIEALASALPSFEQAKVGIHELLELLREELLRDQSPVPAELGPWLANFDGSSRAAKVAVRLARS